MMNSIGDCSSWKLAGNFWGWGVPRTFPRKDDLPDAHKGKPSIRPDGDGSIGAAELTYKPFLLFLAFLDAL
eukprot:gene8925-biopygen3956